MNEPKPKDIKFGSMYQTGIRPNQCYAVFVTKVWKEEWEDNTYWHVAYRYMYPGSVRTRQESLALATFYKIWRPLMDKAEIELRLREYSKKVSSTTFAWMLRSKALPFTKEEKGMMLLSQLDV